jgi:hypothetical protein
MTLPTAQTANESPNAITSSPVASVRHPPAINRLRPTRSEREQSLANTSHHLRTLARAALVLGRRRGATCATG